MGLGPIDTPPRYIPEQRASAGRPKFVDEWRMVSRFLGMGLYSRGSGVDNPIDRTTTTPPQNGFYDCRSECRSRLGHLTKFLPFEVVWEGVKA
jgi:hypothetical protein